MGNIRPIYLANRVQSEIANRTSGALHAMEGEISGSRVPRRRKTYPIPARCKPVFPSSFPTTRLFSSESIEPPKVTD